MTDIISDLKSIFYREPTAFDILQFGNQRYRQGRYEIALHAYRIALEHTRKIKDQHVRKRASYEIRNRIIAALFSLRDYEKAIQESDALINDLKNDKEESDVQRNLLGKIFVRKGGCHYFLQQYHTAFQNYEEALKYITNKTLIAKTKRFLELAKPHEERMKIYHRNAKKPIYKIPTRGLLTIAQFLDIKSICALNRVSFIFHELANSRLLWKSLCDRDFPSSELSMVKDWKTQYLDMLSKNSMFSNNVSHGQLPKHGLHGQNMIQIVIPMIL